MNVWPSASAWTSGPAKLKEMIACASGDHRRANGGAMPRGRASASAASKAGWICRTCAISRASSARSLRATLRYLTHCSLSRRDAIRANRLLCAAVRAAWTLLASLGPILGIGWLLRHWGQGTQVWSHINESAWAYHAFFTPGVRQRPNVCSSCSRCPTRSSTAPAKRSKAPASCLCFMRLHTCPGAATQRSPYSTTLTPAPL